MPQNRIFYAIHLPGLATLGSETYVALHGVQSVTINTNFNLEQVFQLGQLALYENIENIPDIEVTMEKVLDGYAPIYLQATKGATAATLAGRSNIRTSMALSIYDDDNSSASGTPVAQCTCSGLYPSQINYNFPVDGNATESITLVGNNKVWNTGQASFTFTPSFDNTDSPIALSGSGGVNRREDFLMGSGYSKFPTEIPGIQPVGSMAAGYNLTAGESYEAHVQNVRVSTNLGRTELFELGRRGPYHRFVDFPTEVRTDIEFTATLGDNIDAYESSEDNLTDQAIIIKMREGTTINLGVNNKLASVSYSGGNAAQNGGNVTIQYSYSNFNDLTVTHPADPTTSLRP